MSVFRDPLACIPREWGGNPLGGWTEREIDEEVARLLKQCDTEQQRSGLLDIAAEARAAGNCWPLRPKPVAMPPLHLEGKAR